MTKFLSIQMFFEFPNFSASKLGFIIIQPSLRPLTAPTFWMAAYPPFRVWSNSSSLAVKGPQEPFPLTRPKSLIPAKNLEGTVLTPASAINPLAEGRQDDEGADHDPENAHGDDQAHAGDALVRWKRQAGKAGCGGQRAVEDGACRAGLVDIAFGGGRLAQFFEHVDAVVHAQAQQQG